MYDADVDASMLKSAEACKDSANGKQVYGDDGIEVGKKSVGRAIVEDSQICRYPATSFLAPAADSRRTQRLSM